jgi:hypothetical protein
MARAVGRPTVVTDELLKRAEKYLTEWAKDGTEAIPTIEGLALKIGVARTTLYDRPEFADILEVIKTMQAFLLISNGLKGTFNATITKLMLSKHGYIEQTAQDLTTKGKELPAPILGGITKDVHSDNRDEEAVQA